MSSGKKRRFNSSYTARNQVELIRGGKDYFDRLVQMIRNAKSTIHMQTYIYDADETGQLVASELMEAAARGVRVFLLLDGYASQELPKEFTSKLKSAGIHFRWFAPLMKSRYFYFGRRMHHKVIVADGITGMAGGVNITNRYNDMPGQPAWLDWALYVRGEASVELFYRCRELWNGSGWGRMAKETFDEDVYAGHQFPECPVRVRVNDWVRRKNQITWSYLEMLKKARSHVYIMSSYFLPGRTIKKSIIAAAKRGIRIKVIVAGKSDVMVAKHAERHLYRWLLLHRIELYEYQPNILHAKLSTSDGSFVTVGSYNVNNISAYASIELNLDVLEKDVAMDTEQRLEQIIGADCMRVNASVLHSHNHFLKRLWQMICYQFVRVLFTLSTFYFKQRA